MREEIKSMAWLWYWVIGIFLLLTILGIAGTAAQLSFLPWVRAQETHVIRNTTDYVTSRQTALTTEARDYRRVEVLEQQARQSGDTQGAAKLRGQRCAIVDQMRVEETQLEDDRYVPADAATILRSSGC